MQDQNKIFIFYRIIRLLFNYKILFFSIFQSFNFLIFQFVFSQTQLDQFQYNYEPSRNRLTHIDDVIDAANSTIDIDDQAEGNYEYNAIGQLTKDEAEGIESIEWHVNGKVSSVTKTDGSTISFIYDAMGNRISKTLTTHNTVNGGTGSQLTTIYLRDAKGNLIVRYEKGDTASINLKEFSLYGGPQLGTLETEIDQNATESNDSTFARTLATKNYELKDHLGNVRAVVSDIKNSTLNLSNNPANFLADITMTSEYYSYGMQMPGRSYQNSNYKYGFQGKEKDNEPKGENNSYDFGARMYDPRVGRWLSTDPLEDKDPARSTFCAMADNPTNKIDPDGRETVTLIPDAATDPAGMLGALTPREGDVIAPTGQSDLLKTIRIFNAWKNSNKKPDYEKVVIKVHGRDGELYLSLGNQPLSAVKVSKEDLDEYASRRKAIPANTVFYADGEPGAISSLVWNENEDWVKAFRSLSENMTADGTIEIGGCNLAQGENGEALLKAICTITNRSVVAGSYVQSPVTSEVYGERVRATMSERGAIVTRHASNDPIYDYLYHPDTGKLIPIVKFLYGGYNKPRNKLTK